MPLSYAQAAQRADRAMYRVDVVCSCPECGEDVECIVHGTDVSILHPCIMQCHKLSHFDRAALDDAAIASAAGERQSYLHHLRDGGA